MTYPGADAATLDRARERLNRIEEIREAQRLASTGRSEPEIADLLDTTRPRVRRMLSAANRLDVETPEEIILRAAVDGSDRNALARRLGEFTYTFRTHAPRPFEAATSGSWDDIKHAYATGLLSSDEARAVAKAVARRDGIPVARLWD